MHFYFHLGPLTIPGYGLMIATGAVLANVIAMFVLKKRNLDLYDFIILEAYTVLGGFTGAKVLYLVVSAKQIDWSRILEADYFNMLMRSGFVFYGGLIGGLLTVMLGAWIHKISPYKYIKYFIFLIPFIHGFGRIGCYNAGCCYGIPYDGPFAVVFPELSAAPAGISLFPVQIVEAICLLCISLVLLVLLIKGWNYMVETYFVLYAIVRFIIEEYRYDEARGFFLGLSTSRWISIGMVVAALVIFTIKKIRQKNQKQPVTE